MLTSFSRALRTARRVSAVSAAVIALSLSGAVSSEAAAPVAAQAQRVDLSRTTQSQTTLTTQAAGYRCTTVTHNVAYKTTLGLKAFTWTAKARWCHNGKKVRDVSHSSYLSANNGFNRLRAPSVDRQFWANRSHTAAITEVAGHVENCVPKLGCVADYYPYASMTLRASGSHSWNTHR